ncbi:MAG: hypothetical protein ACC742_00355 [Thermoanaerobaculales bacterium]
MKSFLRWGVVWICALGFALLVDKGVTHFSVPDYLWLSVNLTLFLFLLQRYVGRPVAAFLDTRGEGIAQELENAKEQLVGAEKMREDVARRLDEVEEEMRKLKERAEQEAAAEAAKIAEQAREEEERFLRRVEEEIGRREAETRDRLAKDTAELTAQLARELLQQEMTEEDRRRVLDRSLAAMGVLGTKE